MRFGWINIFGACFDAIILLPCIISMIRNKGRRERASGGMFVMIGMICFFACILLMWFPLLIGKKGVWKFGFPSIEEFLIYLFVNGLLLFVYIIMYILQLKEKNRTRTVILGAVPTVIFLLSGILLRHWLLVGFAIVLLVSGILLVSDKCKGVYNGKTS